MARRRKRSASTRGGWLVQLQRRVRFARVLGVCLAVFYAAYWTTLGGGWQLGAGMLGNAGRSVVDMVGLNVQDVTVTGRHYTRTHEILDALSVAHGDSIFSIDPYDARDRVMKLDWVQSAEVTRFYPHTVHVEIDEYQPIAVWRNGEVFSLVHDQGTVVSVLDVDSFSHLPLVEGSGAAEAAVPFLAELSRRPAIAERVRASLRIGSRRWSLQLDNGVIVHLPEQGVDRALDELIELNERAGLIDRDVSVVDMRLPDRITVRPGRSQNNESASVPVGKLAGANT